MACACSVGSSWTATGRQIRDTDALQLFSKLLKNSIFQQGFFGGMFQQLRYVLEENHVIFRTRLDVQLQCLRTAFCTFMLSMTERITFVLATALWICGSVLMYYAERDNPDEGSLVSKKYLIVLLRISCKSLSAPEKFEALATTSARCPCPSG